MDDERVVISSGLVFSPETVASRGFNVVFRGYEQNEVRAFLKRVADEMTSAAGREAELRKSLQDALNRAAHPELNEEVLTTALGEHAARLLTNAREAAAAMISDAETRSARVLQEAEAKIAKVRSEADTLLARRTEEAERLTMGLRQAAEADARAVRERARAEAEAEVESARTQGREMVAEARSVRERMLADLTRRQRIAEAQVEQLRSVRQRL
ncbi:MAG TPA: DivIVA domain-containing protein, partial [Acidimicrobiales bacterium]